MHAGFYIYRNLQISRYLGAWLLVTWYDDVQLCRKLPNCFQSGCTVFRSYSQWMRAAAAPHPCLQLVSSVFWISAVLRIVPVCHSLTQIPGFSELWSSVRVKRESWNPAGIWFLGIINQPWGLRILETTYSGSPSLYFCGMLKTLRRWPEIFQKNTAGLNSDVTYLCQTHTTHVHPVFPVESLRDWTGYSVLAGVLDDGDAVMSKSDVVLSTASLQSPWGDKQLQYTAVRVRWEKCREDGHTSARASDI